MHESQGRNAGEEVPWWRLGGEEPPPGPTTHLSTPQHARFLLAPSLAHELIRLHSSLCLKRVEEKDEKRKKKGSVMV